MRKTLTILLLGVAAFCRGQTTWNLQDITNVNLGTGPNTGTGDPAVTAFGKENTNTLSLSNVVAGLQSGALPSGLASTTAFLSQDESNMDTPSWVPWKASEVHMFQNIGRGNLPNTLSRIQNGKTFKIDLAGTGFMSWMATDLATNFVNQFPLAGQEQTANAGQNGAVLYFSPTTNMASINNNAGGLWFTGINFLTNNGTQSASAGVLFNGSFASGFKFNQIEVDEICSIWGTNLYVSTNNGTVWVTAATLNTYSPTIYGTNWVVSLPAWVTPGQSVMFSQNQLGTNYMVDQWFENTTVSNGVIIGDSHIGAAGHFNEFLAVSNSIVSGIYSGENPQLYLFQDIDSSGQWITNAPQWFTFLRTNNPGMDISVANIPPQPADHQGGDSDAVFLNSVILSNAVSAAWGFNLYDWYSGMENTNNEVMRGWTTNGDGVTFTWPHVNGYWQGWDGFSAGSYMWYRLLDLPSYYYSAVSFTNSLTRSLPIFNPFSFGGAFVNTKNPVGQNNIFGTQMTPSTGPYFINWDSLGEFQAFGHTNFTETICVYATNNISAVILGNIAQLFSGYLAYTNNPSGPCAAWGGSPYNFGYGAGTIPLNVSTVASNDVVFTDNFTIPYNILTNIGAANWVFYNGYNSMATNLWISWVTISAH